jgi:hypothetical protein
MIDSSTLATIMFVLVVGAFLGSSVRNLFHAGHDPLRHNPRLDD